MAIWHLGNAFYVVAALEAPDILVQERPRYEGVFPRGHAEPGHRD